MGDDKIDNTISSVTATIVGVVLICSALIPIAIGQISFLNGLTVGTGGPDMSQYVSLIEVVITMVIIGLVVIVVRSYTRHGE